MAKKKTKKTSKAAIVLIILAIPLFISGAMLIYGYNQEVKAIAQMRTAVEVETYHEGIVIGDVPIGNMTKDQAQSAVKLAVDKKLTEFTATITVEARDWNVVLPPTSDAAAVLEEAYRIGRVGELDQRYDEIVKVAQEGRIFPISYQCDTSGLATIVGSIGDELDIPMVNAAVAGFDNATKKFSFTEESPGRMLDRTALTTALNDAVAQGQYPIAVVGTINTVAPEVTRASLEANNKLLSSFTTKTTSDAKRNGNIKLASSAFHGAVIQPGETFSINAATGPRTLEKGYQEAGAIKNGKLIPELGGGVCQVSTTLFNSVVRANLEIVERRNHSYPISYVERGMDAMIDYQSGNDLKFLNNTVGPVYLVVHFAEQKLTIEVYGTPTVEEGVTLSLRADTTQTIEMPAVKYQDDASLPLGFEETERPGRTGYKVTTYLQYFKGETLLEEKLLFKSNYVAYAPIIRVGTMTSLPTVSAVPSVPSALPTSTIPIITAP